MADKRIDCVPVMDMYIPRHFQDLQQTSEDLHLEDFSSKAVLNVIKFIYAGEILMIGNCEEEILLAERLASF